MSKRISPIDVPPSSPLVLVAPTNEAASKTKNSSTRALVAAVEDPTATGTVSMHAVSHESSVPISTSADSTSVKKIVGEEHCESSTVTAADFIGKDQQQQQQDILKVLNAEKPDLTIDATTPTTSNDSHDNTDPVLVTPDAQAAVRASAFDGCIKSISDNKDEKQQLKENDVGEDDDALPSPLLGSLEHPTFSPPGLLTVTTITTTTTTNITADRNRVLSLDRDTFGGMSYEDNDHSDDDDNKDDADSSDGESSYFAKHLPSPKGGRRFEDFSNHSAPARTALAVKDVVNKPSDASLSFSDESDDESLPPAESPEPVAPLNQQRGQVADMQLQTLTRVHSVSSLVSTDDEASQHSHPAAGNVSPSSSISGNSDPSVNAELSTVRASSNTSKSYGRNSSTNNGIPSGRRSPVPADPAFQHYYNTSPANSSMYGPHSSPPTIFPGYNAAAYPQGMLHPQAQSWSTNHHIIPAVFQQQQQQNAWPANKMSSNRSSDGNINFQYSDDETDDTPFMNQLTSDPNMGGYNTFGVGNSHRGVGGAPEDFGRGPDGAMNSGSYPPSGGDQGSYEYQQARKNALGLGGDSGGIHGENLSNNNDDDDFQVYWRRWLMLFFMSILNLLSDWTCYSVAPIAILTQETFGAIDPERLVVIFLGANAISSACEPIILARLGLKKTVLFGALLLMIGSIIKSGGLPPIIQGELLPGRDEWRLSFGFFLVGLSQPLYQCTPALLSASWFPEKERTMATGVALNANQLGIGCAFVFGTLLVSTSDDIPAYLGLLSILSTLTFAGTLFFFEDAPPTPPSSSAKVMKGDIVVPDMGSIVQSVRNMHSSIRGSTSDNVKAKKSPTTAAKSRRRSKELASAPSPAILGSTKDPNFEVLAATPWARKMHSSIPEAASLSIKAKRSPKTASKSKRRNKDIASAPSPAIWGSTKDALAYQNFEALIAAPSPMMPGPTQSQDDESPLYADGSVPNPDLLQGGPPVGYPMYPGVAYGVFPPGGYPPVQAGPAYGSYQSGYFDPRMQQQQGFYPPPPHPYYYGYQHVPTGGMYGAVPPHYFGYGYEPEWEEGAEPVVTVGDHHLDINIRDDQVLLSIRTCMARPGFVHCLVSFTVSGIVINTLSTYMDYLVTLNGAGREYVGIVGGSFQGIIMIGSLVIGGQTDRTRAYYSVIVCMLVLGAFGLAQCGVSLDADRGGDLRWALLIVAGLIGPLQPVSTELGVEVAYPLSENTVLVIQQLFSNLLSALFIPFFKALKDIGIGTGQSNTMDEKPQYTFSFYLLIVLHAGATVFFATFKGRYLRYEHELEKEASKEQRKLNKAAAAFHPVGGYSDSSNNLAEGSNEHQPLASH